MRINNSIYRKDQGSNISEFKKIKKYKFYRIGFENFWKGIYLFFSVLKNDFRILRGWRRGRGSFYWCNQYSVHSLGLSFIPHGINKVYLCNYQSNIYITNIVFVRVIFQRTLLSIELMNVRNGEIVTQFSRGLANLFLVKSQKSDLNLQYSLCLHEFECLEMIRYRHLMSAFGFI